MECVLIIYKNHIPLAEIIWTGDLPKSLKAFARKHGGDSVEIQSLDEYKELNEIYNLI
jgi:hypothetical protein